MAIRSDHDSLFRLGLRTNLPLLGAVGPTFLLQMATIYLPALNPVFDTPPLPLRALLFCLLLAPMVFAVVEIKAAGPARPLILRAAPTAWIRHRFNLGALTVKHHGTHRMPEHDLPPDPERQRDNDALLANALASVANAIFITDAAGHIRWANRAFSRLSGYAVEEVLGRTPALMKSGMQRDAFYADLWRTILGGKPWRGLLVDRGKDGELYTVDQTITPLLDEHGAITHFIAIQQDARPHGSSEEQDHYLARHDALTGLPNRLYFSEIERQQLEYSRGTGHPFALLFLDLDRFKEVNDNFGHASGDQLLLAVAERLRRAIRESDTVARFGGDEFAILLSEVPDQRIVIGLAEKLNHAMAQPFVIGDKTVCISASIGAAIYPADGDESDDLMRKADEAMYSVKKSGGNGHQLYNAASPILNR